MFAFLLPKIWYSEVVNAYLKELDASKRQKGKCMIDKIRIFVRKRRFLKFFLSIFNFKKFLYNLLFNFKVMRNIPFKYLLPDGNFIKIYPQGQIAKPLYIGYFESDEIKLFFSFLKEGMHVVDAGANIGLYSIISNEKLKGKGKVWAFEPSVKTYDRLLSNLSLNKCNDCVIPVNLGLGNKDSEEQFLRRDTGYGDAEKYILSNNQLPNEELPNINKKVEEEVINLTTLDSYMDGENNSKVDFFKMDTEGYEFFGLQGARKILASNPMMVFMLECTELGTKRARHTQQDVYNILNEFGFSCYYWNASKQVWDKDKTELMKAGNIWACRSIEQLPALIN